MSAHTLLPGGLKIEFPASEKWISFTAPSDMNYQGLKCSATMDDGTVLLSEFDSENKANFCSFVGEACIKFEIRGSESRGS
ncbi:hypothetical protein D3C72_2477420 [compost metagenome]